MSFFIILYAYSRPLIEFNLQIRYSKNSTTIGSFSSETVKININITGPQLEISYV